jgi:hypothetical protein
MQELNRCGWAGAAAATTDAASQQQLKSANFYLNQFKIGEKQRVN